MEIVTLYPTKEYDYEGEEHGILEMLNILFVSDMLIEMKKQHLEKNYGIRMTKEVDDMCNLSQGVLARGIEQGFMQGKAEGKAKGKAEERIQLSIEHVMNLVQSTNMSMKEAMDILKVADDIRPAVLEIIEKMK